MVVAEIRIWNTHIGAVAWNAETGIATMEFSNAFVSKGIDLAPLTMPLSELRRGSRIFSFPELNTDTFRRLPGLLADSLPDRFGNRLIDLWLAKNGRSADTFSPLERLCYVGNRAMGALEFKPATSDAPQEDELQLSELVDVAAKILKQKEGLSASLKSDKNDALRQIIQVGTSAGGMRPKAVVAINDKTDTIISGQRKIPEGFEHWLLKFDGIEDQLFGEAQGYGITEYVYYQMATTAGISMPPCRLLRENDHAHFMTKRFDRIGNEKVHMQTLCGIAHYDFNDIGAYSYEQLFNVMRRLRLPYPDAEEMYRRMVFNVVARNQDDHTKNTAFLLRKNGTWRLSPAYDITFSFNPAFDRNTSRHQMSIMGKRENISRADLLAFAKIQNIKKANAIIDEVCNAVSTWQGRAKAEDLASERIKKIESVLNYTI